MRDVEVRVERSASTIVVNGQLDKVETQVDDMVERAQQACTAGKCALVGVCEEWEEPLPWHYETSAYVGLFGRGAYPQARGVRVTIQDNNPDCPKRSSFKKLAGKVSGI